MQFLIIRHGDPDYVHDSLTEKGFREAELLARRLKKEGVDKHDKRILPALQKR